MVATGAAHSRPPKSDIIPVTAFSDLATFVP